MCVFLNSWQRRQRIQISWHSIYSREDGYNIEQGGGRNSVLPGARIEHVTERVEKIVGRGNGGTILVHVGTNNAERRNKGDS